MLVVEAPQKKVLSCGDCDKGLKRFGHVITPQAMGESDVSAYACPVCEETVTKEQELQLKRDSSVTCINHHKFSIRNTKLKVLPTAVPLMSEDVTKQTIWYHATKVRNWHEAVSEAGIYVHAGSREAALERAADKFFLNRKKMERHKIYLWELSINPDAVIADVILSDENQWPKEVTFCTREHLGGDVQRYLNRWESTGSISILADPRAFKAIRVKTVRTKECAPFMKY